MNLDIPAQFALCQNRGCPHASRCLRLLAYQHCPQDRPFISVVNPACYPEGEEACPAFRSNEPIRLAWGVGKIFDKIPHATAKQVKAQVIAALGKTLYYRAYREERPLSPQHQKTIQRIFALHGIDQPPAYSRFTQTYQWTVPEEP